MTPSSRAVIAHLYRRAGFGATNDELNVAVRKGFDACVDELVAGLDGDGSDGVAPPPAMSTPARPSKNTDNEEPDLLAWWVDTMITAKAPLREKLVLLLHNHFPTANSKVGWASMMHNQLFRVHGPGPFDVLMRVVATDPAMLIWLDGASNIAQDPNENFARELMERFTMVIGNYTQADVHNGARSFTGWTINWKTGGFMVQDWAIDNNIKTFLGHTGDFDGYDIVNFVTHHPATPPFVTARMFSWLAYPVTPANPVVKELAAGFAKDLNLGKLIESILRHPAFVSEQAMYGLIKQPTEFIVGTMRRFGLTSSVFKKDSWTLGWWLSSLGQLLFEPPNVGGWGINEYWLSTATSLARLQVGLSIAQTVNLSELASLPEWARLTWVQNKLGIDHFSAATTEALARSVDQPEQLLGLAMVTPEYVVN